jgi:hypothetical protein
VISSNVTIDTKPYDISDDALIITFDGFKEYYSICGSFSYSLED